MNLNELKKEIEEKFEKTIGPWVAPFDEAMRFPRLIGEVKSFLLLQSLEQAYNLGEENCKERIREWAKDREKDGWTNFGKNDLTQEELAYNQALSDLKEELNKP